MHLLLSSIALLPKMDLPRGIPYVRFFLLIPGRSQHNFSIFPLQLEDVIDCAVQIENQYFMPKLFAAM